MAASLTSSRFGNFSKRYVISIPNCKTNAWALSHIVPTANTKMRTLCFIILVDISSGYFPQNQEEIFSSRGKKRGGALS